ncbi:MAG: HD domain-containing protein [Verrucomicrobiae bacterium]|nr:HD domain-containing protein [Verrucomicrobiae bacterium]
MPSLQATVHGQITAIRIAQARNNKDYLDLTLSDTTGNMSLKIWRDHPLFDFLLQDSKGAFFKLTATWSLNNFGINHDQLTATRLSTAEMNDLLQGPLERQKRIENDFNTIADLATSIVNPYLRRLCEEFLTEYEEPFRRAAAARDYHHARRGGLVEHVAQMMRAADALCKVYPSINRDLVLAGVLFHDVGKLWENDYEKNGFGMPYTLVGELLGHISIGVEFVNRLWRSLEDDPEFQAAGQPSREHTRFHLLHLIASHHGQREFGAPVTPRTPEAWLLHYVDNLDARIEILQSAYAENPLLAPYIYEVRRPLEGHPVQPLPPWQES